MLDETGWMKTGDLGYFDKDGNLYIVDRVKNMIKWHGMQVSPVELETVLNTHEAVQESCVIGLPDEESGEKPMALVVKKPSSEVTEEELINFVNEKVATHKHLRGGVQFIDKLPKSSFGKLLRNAVKDRALETEKNGEEIEKQENGELEAKNQENGEVELQENEEVKAEQDETEIKAEINSDAEARADVEEEIEEKESEEENTIEPPVEETEENEETTEEAETEKEVQTDETTEAANEETVNNDATEEISQEVEAEGETPEEVATEEDVSSPPTDANDVNEEKNEDEAKDEEKDETKEATAPEQ